jgi:hypothetical protein
MLDEQQKKQNTIDFAELDEGDADLPLPLWVTQSQSSSKGYLILSKAKNWAPPPPHPAREKGGGDFIHPYYIFHTDLRANSDFLL